MRFSLTALVCALMCACGGAPDAPEEALRRWVSEAQEAAEREDRDALMSLLSEHYADARGNDHESIEQMLRFYFLRQDSVVLISKIDELVVSDGTAAVVKLTAGMAGANDAALGFSADAYRFELELELDGGDWLLTGARWGEIGEQLR
ncbi:MAG TPA: hypothetical protein VLB07_02840 [Woeseiaceae bacterium]|nr:hypothetical protein [Woeseiaceae bacterium]